MPKIKLNESKVPEKKTETEAKIRKFKIQLKINLKKTEKFYKLKNKAMKLSRKTGCYTPVCMDFGKNVCVPNITNNDAY